MFYTASVSSHLHDSVAKSCIMPVFKYLTALNLVLLLRCALHFLQIGSWQLQASDQDNALTDVDLV